MTARSSGNDSSAEISSERSPVDSEYQPVAMTYSPGAVSGGRAIVVSNAITSPGCHMGDGYILPQGARSACAAGASVVLSAAYRWMNVESVSGISVSIVQ